MQKLQKIRGEFSQAGLVKRGWKKYIRICVQKEVVKISSKHGRVVNDRCIEWDEQFMISQNSPMGFEIFDEHQFGYHPKELESVMVGNITPDNLVDGKGTWEILYKGQCIGYLSAISSKPDTLPSYKSTMPSYKSSLMRKQSSIKKVGVEATHPNSTPLTLKSIVAQLPYSKFKRAYIKVSIGQREFLTSQIKSRFNEVVYIDSIKMMQNQNDTELILNIFTSDDGQEVLLGKCNIFLLGKKMPKKVALLKDGMEIGECYVEIQTHKNNNKSKLSKSVVIEQSTINNSREGNETTSQELSKSKIFRDDKQISVLFGKNNVPFNREQRFKSYLDKQNERVSYLEQRGFQFKNPGSSKPYRGASFGYGQKVDLSRDINNSPGVGSYKLPSLWDRY